MKSLKKDLKREIILQGAANCFNRFGYNKTTLEDIGKSVYLNKASIYYYFRNKEEIFSEVVVQEAQNYISDLQTKTGRKQGLENKIIYYLSERVRKYNEVVSSHQLSLNNVEVIEQIFKVLYRSIKDKEIIYIQNLLEKSLPTHPNSRHFGMLNLYEISESLFVLSDALKHEALRNQQGFQHSDINQINVYDKITFFVELILRGLVAEHKELM